MSITTILIIAVFVAVVALMVTDKLNAVAALPLMAIVMCAVAGVPFKLL